MLVIIRENILYKGRFYKKGDVACFDDCAALIDRGLVEEKNILGSATHEPVNMPFIETGFIEEKPKKGRPKKK